MSPAFTSTPHSLTDSPVLQALFMVRTLYRCCVFYLLYSILPVSRLCLDTQMHYVTVAHRIQCSHALCRLVAQECGLRLFCLGLWRCLCDVHTMAKSPNDTFLKTCTHYEVTHDWTISMLKNY